MIPASSMIEHHGRCLLMIQYYRFTTMHVSQCEMACDEDPKCLVAAYHAHVHRCHLGSDRKPLRHMQRCAHSNKVYEKLGSYQTYYFILHFIDGFDLPLNTRDV